MRSTQRLTTAEQLTTSKELLRDYQTWLNDPMTLDVIEILKKEALRGLGAIPANLITTNSAEMLLGTQCGAHWAIERMTTLASKLSVEDYNGLIPDYGATEILKEQGYGDKA